MEKLQLLLSELEANISHAEKTNPAVSNSTVGWQIDHSILVINKIIEQLEASDPKNYKWKFSGLRLFISITNTIPRGKVKAPKTVQPLTANDGDFAVRLESARANIARLSSFEPNRYFKHPMFGDLNVKSTVWFLKLHTRHHLKIIRDILK